MNARLFFGLFARPIVALLVGVGAFAWQQDARADFPGTMSVGYCLENAASVCQYDVPPYKPTLGEACQQITYVDPLGRPWMWDGRPHPQARCGFNLPSGFSFKAIGTKSCPANASLVGFTNVCRCSAGYTQSGTDANAACLAAAPPKSAGAIPSGGQGAGCDSNKPDCNPIGNPINPLTGNKYQIETDYAGAGIYPLRFERYYNSNAGIDSGRLGARWRHTYDRSIVVSGSNATVTRPDGKE